MEFNQVKQKHHSIEQGPRLDLWALSNEPKNTQISSFEKASKNHWIEQGTHTHYELFPMSQRAHNLSFEKASKTSLNWTRSLVMSSFQWAKEHSICHLDLMSSSPMNQKNTRFMVCKDFMN